MELTNWLPLSDRGRDLVPCLDFPGGRAAAGFAELAAGVPADACFLHFRQAGDGPLAVRVDRWADELLATGRPVRAVLGFCAGTAMATRLADAIAATGRSAPPPVVVLFDAVPTTGGSLAGQFAAAVEANARHLTADEQEAAHGLAEQLAEKYPDDLPRIAAALTERYDRLMRAISERLSLRESLRQELTSVFTAYLDYLTLASEGGFDMRSSTPLFLTSPDYQPLVEGARTVAFDSGHDDLLRDPKVHQFVADLLRGEHPW
jgi:hypothetical protein